MHDVRAADSPSDFTRAVDGLLERTENVIKIHHSSVVDAGTLKELIAVMARKMGLMELQIDEQASLIRELSLELSALRADATVTRSALDDMRHVKRDLNALRGNQQRLSLSVEHVKEQSSTLESELAAIIAGGAPARKASVVNVDVASTQRSPIPDYVRRAPSSPRSHNEDDAEIEGVDQDVAVPSFTRRSPSRHSSSARPSSSGAPAQHVRFGGGDSESFSDIVSPRPAPRSVAIGAPPPMASRSGPLTSRASRTTDQAASTSSRQQSDDYRPFAGIDLSDTIIGPKISALKSQGPGHLAGLKIGDLVLRFNGATIKSKHDFTVALQKCVPGQCVDIAHRTEGHAIQHTKLFLGAAART